MIHRKKAREKSDDLYLGFLPLDMESRNIKIGFLYPASLDQRRDESRNPIKLLEIDKEIYSIAVMQTRIMRRRPFSFKCLALSG